MGSDDLMVDDGEELINNNDNPSQTSDVFSRLHVRADRKRMRAVSPRIDTGVVLQNMNPRDSNVPSWELTSDKHDAHKSQVYAMISVNNQLYSAAARSLRIWDLDTM